MNRRILIYGAGGHGRVVADAAREAGWEIAGWADADPTKEGRQIFGAPILADSPKKAAKIAREEDVSVVVALGENRLRRKVYEAFEAAGTALATVVHPRAVVAASALLGAGTVVFAGAVVNADAEIGDDVIVNTGVTVDHDCRVGPHAHLSPGAHLGGGVTIGDGAHVGLGVAVRDGISIGPGTVVGAGAAVVRDLPGGVLAYGVPAKVVTSLEGSETS